MDQILSGGIIEAILAGKYTDAGKFIAVFVFIWLEVRGLKKEVKKLNSTIADGFAQGETRFSKIESRQLEFEHRLTGVEPKQQGVTP